MQAVGNEESKQGGRLNHKDCVSVYREKRDLIEESRGRKSLTSQHKCLAT